MNSIKKFVKMLRTSMVGEGTPPASTDHVRARALVISDDVVSTEVTLHPEVIKAVAPLAEEPLSATINPSPPQEAALQCEMQRKSVIGCVSALYTLLEVYGYRTRRRDPVSKHSFDKTVEYWTQAASAIGEGGWMKWSKYKFAAYFHSNTRQLDDGPVSPLPQLKDRPDVLCRGSAHRFMKSLLQTHDRHSFLASILQVKKGCPRPDEALVSAAVEKAKKALTTTRTTPKNEFLLEWADVKESYDEVYLCREALERELKRTVQEIFKGRSYTDADRCRFIFPSTSASYSTGKGSGGKLEDLREFVHESGKVLRNPSVWENEHNLKPIYLDEAPSESIKSMLKDAKVDRSRLMHKERLALMAQYTNKHERVAAAAGFNQKVSRRPAPGQVNLRQKLLVDEENEFIGKGAYVFQVDLRRMEEFNMSLYSAMLEEAMRKPSNVMCVGLAESLKVRVITAGDALKAQVLNPLQKFMWSTLNRHDTFQLTGRPVDAWIIQDRLGAKLLPGQFYLSGDYSAATDNLAPWVSETIGREIAKQCGLSPEEEYLFIENLIDNRVDMATKRKDAGVDLKKQQWGQLMGSIVSFPVLCIANAAMCRWAIELDRGRRTTLQSSGLLINGDDVVFKTTRAGHALWKKITAYGGLESSVGKTFLSDEFAQINSVNFRRLESPVTEDFYTIEKGHYTRERWFEQTPFVNLGLLFGMKRSGEKVGLDAVSDADYTIGARCRELISFAPPLLRHAVMQIFIFHHKSLLDQARVPWYVPEQWGGVGLPTVPSAAEMLLGVEPKFGPSVQNRRGCQRIGEMPKKPNGDLKYPVGQLLPDVTWEMHKTVMSRLPELHYGRPTKMELERFQTLYGALVYDSFLRDDVLRDERSVELRAGWESDMAKEGKSKIKYVPKHTRVLKQNRASWIAVMKDGNLPTHPASATTLFSRDSPKAFLPLEIISTRKTVLPFAFSQPVDDPLWEVKQMMEW